MTRGKDDAELVAAILEGDETASEEVIRRYRDAVVAVALSRLGNFHDAEDVAQEVFVEAYRRLAGLRDPQRLGAWLRSITIHRAIDAVRRCRKPVDISQLGEASAAVSAWRERERNTDVQHEVMAMIAALSRTQRETTTLFYIDGYSVEEVAAIQEVPAGTVKRRLHDARRCLKEEMVGMVENALKSGRPSDDFADKVFDMLCQNRTGTGNPYATSSWHKTVAELRAIGGRGIDGFIRALESPHSPTRVFAAHMLQRQTAAQSGQEIWEALKKALGDPNRKVRRWAVEALMHAYPGASEERKRREIVPLVIPLLSDRSSRVRRDAAWTLVDYASDVPIEAVVKALLAETDRESRKRQKVLLHAIVHNGEKKWYNE
ncbi:MAG: sigma-70 family RNA polymerase sigma factor [Planctomycetota bacterium]